MKPLLIQSLLFSLFAGLGLCQSPDAATKYQEAYAAWEAVAYRPAALPSADAPFEALRQAWQAAPDAVRSEAAYRYAQAAIRTARQLVNSGKHEIAASLLKEAGTVAKSYPVVLGRGRHATAFEDIASVHASVMAATNSDPLEGMPTSYEIGRMAAGFYALQLSPDGDRTTSIAAPTALEGLASNESAGTILRIDSKGTVLQALPVAITDGSGPLRSRLSSIFEHQPAGPRGPSRYVKHGAETFFAAQTDTTPTTKSTSLVSSPSPKNGTKEPPAKPMPTTTSGEPTSSTSWSIIVVLIVAAIGLLWLMLKNRK
jgi:hypothetical protein